jgi:PII-like signaling protein
MQTPQDAVLLRIYLNEREKWRRKPLYEALVLKARDLHLAGATVLRGPMGFGKTNELHTAKILDLSINLPLVVEFVDTQERIDEFLAAVDEMLTCGLVTMEKVKIIRGHPARPNGGPKRK